MLRLSVLDQSVAVADRPHGQSIRDTIALARLCDALGYHRFWVSEHHNHASIAGTAPEVLLAAIAGVTLRIRIGSAGVMLPHYSPLHVAEQFLVLEALAPGRIDLGLGRAPGSDGRTAFALNPLANERPAQFPADVRDVIAWTSGAPLPDGHPFRTVKAHPLSETAPEEEARFQFSSRARVRLLRDLGVFVPLDPPAVAAGHPYTDAERARMDQMFRDSFVGTGTQVAERIAELAKRLDVQEVAVVTWTYDEAVRHESYRLLAEAMGLDGGRLDGGQTRV